MLNGTAQATVHTIAGAFSDRLTIVGRVVVGSADGGWTSVSRGIAGVKILLEDGTTVDDRRAGALLVPGRAAGHARSAVGQRSLPNDVRASASMRTMIRSAPSG